MHIFFSGIGGTAIGPLAMIANQAGFEVSGSDKQDSQYVQYLRSRGIENIHIGQSKEQISKVHSKTPIDWYVYSSAVKIENPDAPELKFCQENGIKTSKRSELLKTIISEKNLKLIAIAGTHGKTTTTAMVVWLFKQLGIPVSYSVGAKISFGEMGEFDANSEYFVLEADEFDRNFLEFSPYFSIISGIAYDHPDIYPSETDYNKAFNDFVCQSQRVVAHPEDLEKIGLAGEPSKYPEIRSKLSLKGKVNRENAQLVIEAVTELTNRHVPDLVAIMNHFPGVSRRFEQIADNLYSDYAHTPEKIRGALQMAHEVAGENVVVVYEGLHNTRQHFIRKELEHLFDDVKKLYIVPSYRAREDENLEDLTPEKLVKLLSRPDKAEPASFDEKLKSAIKKDVEAGDLVLCLSAGGGGSLDEWLRKEFKN